MRMFDHMTFGRTAGCDDMFVADAQRYTKLEAVEICKSNYSYLFSPESKRALRYPTVDDVQDCGCAFRFGNYAYPDGCYMLVGDDEKGAFPVHVIDFERLEKVKGRE